MAAGGSILGNAVRRKEDPRILVGAACYLDDLAPPDVLHVAFVRSTVAHARIVSVDLDGARAAAGVVDVVTADDLALAPHHGMPLLDAVFARPPLARDVVRFVGEPVAVVVAESRAAAVDAAESVVIEYDDLDVVVDPEAALAPDAPVLHPEHGSNLANHLPAGGDMDDALADADVVVAGRFVNQRLAAVPLEVNGCIVEPDPATGGATVWISSQGPHGARAALAGALGLPPEQVRVATPMVGGGFGAKMGVYVEWLVCAGLFRRLGRAVKWVETRSENMVAMHHGRGQVHEVRLGLTRDGRFTGLAGTILQDGGAYPTTGSFLPFFTRNMASGVYRIPKIAIDVKAAATNTTPVAAYRGAGRPEATAMIERIVDLAARELDLDPVELRRRNLIPADEFPYTTATGATYDTGEYERALDEALRVAGYDELRRDQAARRERGDRTLLGIGVSTYVEVTAPITLTGEYARVTVEPDGSATVRVGTSSHGQGHETAFSMLVEEVLGIPMDRVRFLQSDTAEVPRGGGTGGSRSLQVAGSGVFEAAGTVLDQARRLAAYLLEAAPEDIVRHDDGRVGVAGVPARALSWAELATAARGPDLPDEVDAPLDVELDFDQGSSTYPFGAHVAVVEVDADTGAVRFVRHVAVDDCGRVINPLLAAGQVHGGVAQGAAQALFEHMAYDEWGNPVTANLMDYAFPSAAELPSFEVSHTVTPTPVNPLGAKGIGESGTIGATPAVQSAVIDAVAHLGIRHLDMPVTPRRIWEAMVDAGAIGAGGR